MPGPTIQLAHDWLVGMRGGERVLDRLARLYGPTTIHTLVNDGCPLSEAIDACRVNTSPLQRLPGATGQLRRWYLPLMPWAVSRLRVGKCDLLLSTSSAVMKSIRPPAGVPHICYCHSPARYIWEQMDDYRVGRGGRLRAAGLGVVKQKFRAWDRRTADRVTHFLANSAHTAGRIRRCFDRDAEVVHPPVRTEFFTPDAGTSRAAWFLLVSALEPYKRVDLAIEAAVALGVPLKIAGSGSQERALRQMAAGTPSIEFLGRVDDDALRMLYRTARALIHPQQEDFGIIAVEAQACGCPVIAFGAGGALETVVPETGILYPEQTTVSLRAAMERFDSTSFDAASCRQHAERFSEARFDARIQEVVERVLRG